MQQREPPRATRNEHTHGDWWNACGMTTVQQGRSVVLLAAAFACGFLAGRGDDVQQNPASSARLRTYSDGHVHATTHSSMVSLETATWLRGRACGSNHEVAFVHIPKTGGTTISTALARCVNATQMADRFHSTTHHFRASKYIEMLRSRNASWPDVFSFTMVRDPYARAVSTFYYKASGCIDANHSAEHPSRACSSLPYRGPLRHALMSAASAAKTFSEWVHKADAENRLIEELHEPQVDWLGDGSSPLAVSLVLKLDGPQPLQNAWAETVGYCLPQCANIKLTRENSIRHASTFEHYVASPSAAAIVERVHARDFATLGYPYRPWKQVEQLVPSKTPGRAPG